MNYIIGLICYYDRVCGCCVELREVDKQVENRESILDVWHCIIVWIFQDKNGYIDKKELQSVMGGLNSNEINELMKSADADKDGRLNLQEFTNLI